MTKPVLPILNAALAMTPRMDMPVVLAQRGTIVARLAATPEDRGALYRFRAERFLGRSGLGQTGPIQDRDAFDPFAIHVVIEDRGDELGAVPSAEPRLVAGYRAFFWPTGSELDAGYTGQFYGLERLAEMRGAKLEIGRLCVCDNARNPDIARVLMASVAQLARHMDAVFLFGCSSFRSADPARHAAALAHAFANHPAPKSWEPGPRAAQIVVADDAVVAASERSPHGLPPMLRQVLRHGGRVSEHAVIDKSLDTLHVFTGLPLWKVPRGYRERLLQF